MPKGIKNSPKICEYCGKEFWKLNMSKDRKYCSRRCAGKARKIGKIIKCEWCGKKVYKHRVHLEKHKHYFCSLKCSNAFQGINKIEFICKICGKIFKLSKSKVESRKYPIKYCSIECRNEDPDFDAYIKGNLAQLNKKGLNNLELKGRKILEDIGLLRNVDFYEQKLLFNKFIVDIYLPSYNLVIQWDGIYWHNKPERKRLDKSQDAYMKKCGLNVLRITDEEINKKEVYDDIRKAI